MFVPAILLVLFLLNSFVPKEKDAEEKAPEEIKYLAGMALRDKLIDSFRTASVAKADKNKSGLENIVFKSTDGGQTWQDISKGLPENLLEDGFERDGYFANESGLYLRAANGIYHNKPNSSASLWTKENFSGEQGSIAPGKNRMFAYNYKGQFAQKTMGTGVWSPIYKDVKAKGLHTVIETVRGTVIIGSENGIFKSTNSGKTWKQVHTGGWVMKLAESNGVLLATSQNGILRSTDNGENWVTVISEGGVGIDVERIRGGFAAISYNTLMKSRRIHISLDGGQSWKIVGNGLQPYLNFSSTDELPPSMGISSIKQVGEYLLCGHPDGIYRSSDMGKTWKLLLPSVDNKVFNLSVSGNVIYAIPRPG